MEAKIWKACLQLQPNNNNKKLKTKIKTQHKIDSSFMKPDGFLRFGNTWYQQLFEFDLLKYNEIMIVWKNIELSNTSTSLHLLFTKP
jgi:hypothetical protein